MSYEFQNILYRTEAAMLAAIACEWLTAGGANSSADIDEILQREDCTPESIARECIDGWGLDQAGEPDPYSGDEPTTWMEDRDITEGDIVSAFREFIAKRPDR